MDDRRVTLLPTSTGLCGMTKHSQASGQNFTPRTRGRSIFNLQDVNQPGRQLQRIRIAEQGIGYILHRHTRRVLCIATQLMSEELKGQKGMKKASWSNPRPLMPCIPLPPQLEEAIVVIPTNP
jgi:hypothetical protein